LGVILLHEISDNFLQFKPFNYSHKPTGFHKKNQPFACLIMPFPNLHMSAICKLGKGIN
jgi:hypothetical protein